MGELCMTVSPGGGGIKKLLWNKCSKSDITTEYTNKYIYFIDMCED